MTRILFWTFLTIGMAAGTFLAAEQNPQCGDRTRLVDMLFEHYGEIRMSSGLDPAGNFMETWANLRTGTWTIFVTEPGGRTCIFATGNDFDRETIPGNV